MRFTHGSRTDAAAEPAARAVSVRRRVVTSLEAADAPLRTGAIAKAARCSRLAAVKALRRLERDGLVASLVDPSRRPGNRVTWTQSTPEETSKESQCCTPR